MKGLECCETAARRQAGSSRSPGSSDGAHFAFAGDIGGQMGLFIGASLLTILEIFDYLYEVSGTCGGGVAWRNFFGQGQGIPQLPH